MRGPTQGDLLHFVGFFGPHGGAPSARVAFAGATPLAPETFDPQQRDQDEAQDRREVPDTRPVPVRREDIDGVLVDESGLDRDDPGPWLNAYDAGVGSPLELKFLRLFEQHGLEVEKQVAVSAEPDGRKISQADFQITGTKVLIYIDGAAFHTGARLRRDRVIRKSLRSGSIGWKVAELRHPDLSKGVSLVGELKALI